MMIYPDGSGKIRRDPIRPLPMTTKITFSSGNLKIFQLVGIKLNKLVARVVNTVICSLVVTILTCSWSMGFTPLNADASSENGLIFYSDASRFQAETGQKDCLQRIENNVTIDPINEHQQVKDTTGEIRSRDDHE